MNQHLLEISHNVAVNAHAVLIMDQAGWHVSNNLVVPQNITILPLPLKLPELNLRKHLAVHEGQLDLKPRLQVLRGYRRPLLLRMENHAEAAMEDHVHWPSTMGERVLINDRWYWAGAFVSGKTSPQFPAIPFCSMIWAGFP